eukprot:scaffold8066_cov157-Isochrysis_galbana.AAC.3
MHWAGGAFKSYKFFFNPVFPTLQKDLKLLQMLIGPEMKACLQWLDGSTVQVQDQRSCILSLIQSLNGDSDMRAEVGDDGERGDERGTRRGSKRGTRAWMAYGVVGVGGVHTQSSQWVPCTMCERTQTKATDGRGVATQDGVGRRTGHG